MSFTNASYSGGIIITDWFAGNQKSKDNNNLRELKITVRFLSNDKKNKLNKINFSLLNGIGDCTIDNLLSENEL